MDRRAPGRADEHAEGDVAERLRWLLRLRWLVVPLFVAASLASDLVLGRTPWLALAVGAVLLAANAAYAWLLARRRHVAALLRWARIESGVVVAIPAAAAVLAGDPTNPLRYGVLVGVVGAAVVLPRTAEIAVVGTWAVVALVVGDAAALRFDPARIGPATVARWAMDGGLVLTVAVIAAYLHSTREWTGARLRDASLGLERTRAEWEAAFDALAEMVFVTDRDGLLLRANRAFATAVGGRLHELAGRRLSELLAGHPQAWWSSPADGIIEVEDPLFDTLFEITSTRVADRVVRVARDVGEQRRMHVRLVQADKLAAVGVLASGVAHEVNNPTAFVTSNLTELRRYVASYEAALGELSAIGMEAGQAERVRGALAGPEVAFARRESANAIAESLEGMERIRQLVANLRTLARRDQASEPAVPVDLAEVVQTVVRTAASDLRAAHARLDVRGPVHVLGRRGELTDVVLNLVVNALQAAEDGRENEVGIEVRRDGGSALLRVSDTGRGISPAHMKRLFEPFFTTKAPGEGTGLGLSLARKIVLAHGGSIDVASEVGVGSTFTVRLPAAEPGEERARRRESGAA
jgi:PAS domain S-box-containing protein